MDVKIQLDAETLAVLEDLARRRGQTASEVARQAIEALLHRVQLSEGVAQGASMEAPYLLDPPQPLPPLKDDPLMKMAGIDEFEPQDIDEVVYG